MTLWKHSRSEYLPVITNQYQNDTVFHTGVDIPEPPENGLCDRKGVDYDTMLFLVSMEQRLLNF